MIGIVGATGLVGLEARKILAASGDPLDKTVLLFASQARPDEKIMALESSVEALSKCRFIINAATNETAEWLRERLQPDQVLIDNSSAFRMDPDVPLVIPEVNGEQLEAPNPVIANPNCTAIILCLALNVFKDSLQRVIVSTYQAASGAGLKGLEELEAQVKAAGMGVAAPAPSVFPFPLHLNVLSHNSPLREAGRFAADYNDEEGKVIEETRKILGIYHLPLSATCVRVPVRRAHTESVTIDLKTEMPIEEVRSRLAKAPGLKVVDDRAANRFPMPLDAEGADDVLVGRIRKDAALPRTIHFMLSGDQIRKGAALNAIQIVRHLRTLQD